MELCPKSLVEDNTINVLAAGDVLAIGIKVKDSPLIDIFTNTVTVEANGNNWAVAIGIKVKYSDQADVNGNTVTVDANMIGSNCGFLLAKGIYVKECEDARVTNNVVGVTGIGDVNATTVLQVTLSEDEAEDLADLDEILLDSVGNTLSWAGGSGLAIGIKVSRSSSVTVTGNNVDVILSVDVIATDQGTAVAGGGGVAAGIKAVRSPRIKVVGNGVDVDAAVRIWVRAVEVGAPQFGAGGGKSIALGIVLYDSSRGKVEENLVGADGDLEVTIESVYSVGGLEADSALSRFDSEVIGAIQEALIETLQDEAIDVQLSGDVPSIESFSAGGGAAVGLAILVLCSDSTTVTDNAPVAGTGDVMATVLAEEERGTEAGAAAGALGLGGGVVVIDSREVTVSDNDEVSGAGTAAVDVEALHSGQVGTSSTWADGVGAGIGLGILLCGLSSFADEADGLPEDQHWSDSSEVVNNEVVANGSAVININAEDFVISHDSQAWGAGLGLGLGITALWEPWVLIEDNLVEANGDALADVWAEAVHEFDPVSTGHASGIGIAIMTKGSCHAEIVDNEAVGTGRGTADVGAYENVILSSTGVGGSLGLGEGILVYDSRSALVTGNSVANGMGHANTLVIAISEIPLGEAYSDALAAGIGKGIAVVNSPKADVVECNTAAGAGSAEVYAFAGADFSDADSLGVAVSVDILMMLLDRFDQVQPEHRRGFGHVNYNSMVDVSALGSNSGPVEVLDAGLLKIGGCWLDARYNWWNHATGPWPVGLGEAVEWWGWAPVEFEPWLYVVHTRVLDEQLGMFAFTIDLAKGLNTLSAPIALEQTVVPSRTWGDILTNSALVGEIKYADRWDPATQSWVPVLPTDNVDPLDGMYVYLFHRGAATFMVNSDIGHQYSMPSRQLLVPADGGWALVAPNPLWDNSGIWVDRALNSLLVTPAGLPGYTQAISPVVNSQDAWYFVPGEDIMSPEWMDRGRAYWVWIENTDILVGFGFSPLPDLA
jgi:hypothetical protein